MKASARTGGLRFGLPLEWRIFASMFDGTPIPSSPFDAAAPLWVLLFLLVALTSALRVGYAREWGCLTGRSALPWREGGTAEHREGGTWWVLAIGWIGWMFAGAAWEWSRAEPGASVSWMAVIRWWGVGVGTECLRWTTGRFGAWLTLQPELLGGMTRMDRRLRVWWAWGTAATWLFIAAHLPGAEVLRQYSGVVVYSWGIWCVVKWMWMLFRLARGAGDLRWGFAYLCTLEIIPSAGLAWFVWRVWA